MEISKGIYQLITISEKDKLSCSASNSSAKLCKSSTFLAYLSFGDFSPINPANP